MFGLVCSATGSNCRKEDSLVLQEGMAVNNQTVVALFASWLQNS